MLLVLSLICTTLEFSRVSSAQTRSNEITYMALDSCFSSYAKEVFEDYGIFVLWQSEGEFLYSYQDYVVKNSKYKKDFISNPIDILSIRHKCTDIEEIVYAVDKNGELIERQIYEYMKLALAENIIDEIVDKSESLSQSEDLNVFNDRMEQCSEALENVENSVQRIYQNIQVVKNAEGNPEEILKEMKKRLEEIKNISPNDDYNKAVRDNLFEIYKQEFRKYADWEDKVKNSLRDIMTDTNEYLVNTGEAENEIAVIKNELENSKENFQSEIYDVLHGEIGIIDEQVLSIDKDNYNVISNKSNVIEQKKIVDKVADDMSPIIVEMKELDYSGNKISNYKNNEVLINNMYECVVNALVHIEGYNKECLNVNYQMGNGDKKENEIVEFVKQIKKNGVINYIVGRDLSEKKIDNSELPSKVYKQENNISQKNKEKYDISIRKALIGQYIFDKFKCFTDKEQSPCIDYEIEYILSGECSDKKNLSKVIDKIMVIREGFNLVYLMKDSAKREEAYAMAAAITGFTGMPVVIRITQFLILSAWAYAESIVDVKDLLDGYKVNVMKCAEEWNLSLSGIKNLASSEQNKKDRKGLSYEDYLRFLLFAQDKTEQIYRILDVIELNIRKIYNEKFRFSNCIVGIEINTQYEVKRLFTGIGFVKKEIHSKNKGFLIEVNQIFEY